MTKGQLLIEERHAERKHHSSVVHPYNIEPPTHSGQLKPLTVPIYIFHIIMAVTITAHLSHTMGHSSLCVEADVAKPPSATLATVLGYGDWVHGAALMTQVRNFGLQAMPHTWQ